MNLKITFFSYAMFLILSLQAAYYSQHGQDKYVNEQIFKSKKNGVFVDIGAFDGIDISNTYFFEKELNWTGICIEPIEEVFNLLAKNRNCVCVKGCVFEVTGEKDFLKVKGYPEMLSGLLETYDERHLRRIDVEINEKGGSREVVKVKTYNFNDLCKQNNITHIDYLSIDTEGSEESIIRSINFDEIFIDVISVENNFNSDFFYNFLTQKNYKLLCKFDIDEVYKKID
ncbi:MAG: FkbM family methyltransferase [Candidatus Babeliales bacterium]|nr:FkbM family methyltransferase [Candidatus Babeliales bacterium]